METQTEKETKGWWRLMCTISKRLDGKVAIVTGASSGIGLLTTAELARRGAHVVMACRDMSRAEKSRALLVEKYGANNTHCMEMNVADKSVIPSLSPISEDQLHLEYVDLASFQSIKNFSNAINEQYKKIDFLINNADLVSPKFQRTPEGHELTIGVNYLGPFLLTDLLLPLLIASGQGRIINLSSFVHHYAGLQKPDLQCSPSTFSSISTYAQSKLAVVMYTKELSRRLAGTRVKAVSLNPGMVKTSVNRYSSFSLLIRIVLSLLSPWMINAWQGIQTTMYTILSDSIISGGYYSNCALSKPKSIVDDVEECRWIWKRSCELTRMVEEGFTV
ncbi:unnamed protein product [Calicophoron daubneyi]|uniref:Uncharacterized protein n=1 Tax=Calicophoron daubneyi TaxID=300641 RepID=A0AAV2TQL6_CALDB